MINFIKDHYETYGKVIRLDDVPEEMYGGALPVARSRKSKRKVTSKEEYLEAEQPSKKAKKEVLTSLKLVVLTYHQLKKKFRTWTLMWL
jgi:hypothetical protein